MKNKEFLFIYEARNCNPNGDPDRDNEPRTDKITKTNLVSDARLKRYIRDYFIEMDGTDAIFVSPVGGQKVSPPTRLNAIVEDIEKSEKTFNGFLINAKELKEKISFYKTHISSKFKDKTDYEVFTARNNEISGIETEEKKYAKDFKKVINNALLYDLVKNQFLDIRMFGSAFSIPGYSMTLTGPIQINLGYSLHPVELNSIGGFTLAGDKDGNSGATRKEEVFYSLIGFTGTINGKKADDINLIETEVEKFREALIKSLTSSAITGSKKNQYPKFYLEIEYKEGISGGHLGDLRDHVVVTAIKEAPVNGKFSEVRKYSHLNVSINSLIDGLRAIESKIEKITYWSSLNLELEKYSKDEAVEALKSLKSVEEFSVEEKEDGNN